MTIYGEKMSNPLQKHFRRPAIHMKLPSNGRFWPENTLDLPLNGEIPIMPMTAKDEIALKTPDALLNGAGVVGVIQSCCPNIKDAWYTPATDIDALLVGIRIATYGNSLDLNSKCTKCNADNTHALDLTKVLDGLQCPDYDTPLVKDEFTIKFKPQMYLHSNAINQINFEQQRAMEVIQKMDLDDETKQTEFNKHLNKILEITLQNLANGTQSLTTPDGIEVTDPEHILEFYQNTNSQFVSVLQKKMAEFGQMLSIKPFTVACAECQAPYEIEFTFDYSNFFA
jgi:hypothetical protein